MMSPRPLIFVLCLSMGANRPAAGQPPTPGVRGVRIGVFPQEVARVWSAGDGFPDGASCVAVDGGGFVYAGTGRGLMRLDRPREDGRGLWVAVDGLSGAVRALTANGSAVVAATADGLLRSEPGRPVQRLATWDGALAQDVGPWTLAAGSDSRSYWLGTVDGLWEVKGEVAARVVGLDGLLGESRAVRQVASSADGRIAVAADSGLFSLGPDRAWHRLFPRAGVRSWAPVDVRGVTFDRKGRLWFASPQGIGRLDGQTWLLFTGEEGLPFNDFTTAAGEGPSTVWFGTTIGAIQFDDGPRWSYRQGRRWLPDDRVRAIAVTASGDAWFATAGGVGSIERRPMTLAEKARFFEDEIDLYHRRTPFGYVLDVSLERPGDKSRRVQHDSDNDGLWTSMYGAGECFAYAATRNPRARERAKAAFEAVRFLSQVTQGGDHPAPPGFPARSILPTDGPDPNRHDSPEHDRREQRRDPYWKVIIPRWPRSADGKWYWKSDTSSDELDGHYFLYATYFDLVAETPEERDRVRGVVTAITDHLLAHNLDLIDHDGKPTRWARFGPALLNQDVERSGGRGLNSLSILSYLKVAEHVSGDIASKSKYRAAYDRLVGEHAYATNTLEPKPQFGPGTGNQSDDEMAFMSYYNLFRYETDPSLRQVYARSLRYYWALEAPELCPLFNFLAAACLGLRPADGGPSPWRAAAVPESSLADGVVTLVRFPIDRVRWGYRNSHRIDLAPLANPYRRASRARGRRRDGRVISIDERFVGHWNTDPYQLDEGGEGRSLADGASFLLPYYLGLYQRFIAEAPTAAAPGG